MQPYTACQLILSLRLLVRSSKHYVMCLCERSGFGRGSSKTTKGSAKCDVLSQSQDLAKLNLKCHMN